MPRYFETLISKPATGRFAVTIIGTTAHSDTHVGAATMPNVGLIPNAGSGAGQTISGNFFNDLNADELQAIGGDSALSGITVSLYLAGSTPGVSTPYATTTSAANGSFTLTSPAGYYFLVFSFTPGVTGPTGTVLPTNSGFGWLNSGGSSAETDTRAGGSNWSVGLRPASTAGIIDYLTVKYDYFPGGAVQDVFRYSDAAAATYISATVYAYDPTGLVNDIKTVNRNANKIAESLYTYDWRGRVIQDKQWSHGSRTYAYDNNDQIVTDTGAAYVYDKNGNRVSAGSATYQTGADNRLTSDGTWNYSYDQEGNLTKKVDVNSQTADYGKVWTYGYDNANHLTQNQKWSADPTVQNSGAVLLLEVDYKYDAWGARVQKTVDLDGAGPQTATTMAFVLDGWNTAKGTPVGTENIDVYADLNGDGSLKTRYLRGDKVDELLARADYAPGGGTGYGAKTYWYVTDHLGSIRAILDGNAYVATAAIDYDAFGKFISTPLDPAIMGRYAWTGREIEVETGLQFNRARFYDPSIGRWISKDPLGFAAGDSNLYR